MYKVIVGSFYDTHQADFARRYIVDDQNLKEIICIESDNYMIDICSGDIYPVIKRKNNRIDKNQDIILNKEYALYVDEYKNPNLKDYLLLFRLNITGKNKQKRK